MGASAIIDVVAMPFGHLVKKKGERMETYVIRCETVTLIAPLLQDDKNNDCIGTKNVCRRDDRTLQETFQVEFWANHVSFDHVKSCQYIRLGRNKPRVLLLKRNCLVR